MNMVRNCWLMVVPGGDAYAVDVQSLDHDSDVFTGHKIYGPSGIVGFVW